MATYKKTRKNMTALVPDQLLKDWKSALGSAGIAQAQAFTMGLTVLYMTPTEWTDPEVEGDRPKQANLHIRLEGILGTYVDEIAATMTTKRLANNVTRKATSTDVMLLVMTYFIKLTREGRLMSIGM